MAKESIDPATKEKIIQLISALAPNAKIYLFGSHANGTATSTSDIDIALDAGEKLPFLLYGEIMSVLEGTFIREKIDVVDTHRVDEVMRKIIEETKTVWKS